MAQSLACPATAAVLCLRARPNLVGARRLDLPGKHSVIHVWLADLREGRRLPRGASTLIAVALVCLLAHGFKYKDTAATAAVTTVSANAPKNAVAFHLRARSLAWSEPVSSLTSAMLASAKVCVLVFS